MAEQIVMIALSPTMEEGTIAKWLKKEGDVVKAGDVICEVETDKATMDYESAQEGTILKVVLGEGQPAKVGDVIGIIGKSGEDFSSLLTAAASASQAAPSAVGNVSAAAPVSAGPSPATVSVALADQSKVFAGSASPLARRLAAEKGLNLADIVGSGPGGRVIKRDLESLSAPAAPLSRPAVATAGATAVDQKIPVTGKRAVIAKRLSESMFSAPHIYLTKTVGMDRLLAARTMLNQEQAAKDKVGFNAFLIKLSAEAIQRYPQINASWQGDHILQFGSIDIGLAVDVGNGLITPIIRDVGSKGIVQIDQELKVLIGKAGQGKLQPHEYSGAGFTISNLGSFGIEQFTAIINPPAVAILALGEVKKVPVVGDDNQISIAQVMKFTLSCDHRVIDGVLGARFANELAKMIETPVRVLF